jgi:amino acid adenylation domain-containing protein
MPCKLTVIRPPDFVEFRREAIQQGIHECFEGQVRLHAGNIALKARDAAWTYAETNGFANSLAEEILSVCGTDLARVALLLPNTAEMIVAILAALKAHKAYVPLDRNFPRERQRIMLEDAEPTALLTDDQHLELALELAGQNVRIINMSQVKRHAEAPNPHVPCDPLDLAYILYTSGTTGRPKGIAFLHCNLLHTTMCLINQLFFSASDRVTWVHSPSFGSSVVDIYCCLTVGGTLYPWDVKTQGFNGMSDWLVREKITTFQWIPSAFRQFMRTVPDGLVFRDIRIVVMAGEPLTVREVELFRRFFPVGSHLVNQVGTAESYNYYLYRVDHQIPIESANVPGGYPVSEERQVLILDDERRVLPAGHIGEIGIKSQYMSGGYWRDEALTRNKFIRMDGDETPVYLTGDLGKLEPDGCLIHLGRKDLQVKIRGCRIEVAEVEHTLTTAPGVADSAVWIAKNRLDEDQLVGYVVLKSPAHFDQQAVEEHLKSCLPDYMVPRHYVVLDVLPTLPTGKVDRRALPNPFDRTQSKAKAQTAPPGSTEMEMVNLFKELLQVEDIGPDSDFIKMGGDSLLMAILIHRTYQSYNVEINFDDFVHSPTPARLAGLIQGAVTKGGTRSS